MPSLTRAYGGIEVISTGELCSELGLVVSSALLKRLDIEPVMESGNAIYWRKDGLSEVCLALSVHFAELANKHVGDLSVSETNTVSE
jgi:hypothetical protein